MVMYDPPGDDDRDGLAAEFVLGTLSPGERDMAERLIARDRAFGAEVERWNKRLDPLLDVYQASAAPLDVLANVLIGIGPTIDGSAEITLFRRRVGRWKVGAAVTSAIAAGLAGFVAVSGLSPEAAPGFLAILEDSGRTPAFVAAVDVERKRIAIRRIVGKPALDRSYELWAIRGQDDPESLGLVDRDTGLMSARFGPSVGSGAGPSVLLAVTVEPKGGSPTRKPTSSPLFTGRLVEAPVPR